MNGVSSLLLLSVPGLPLLLAIPALRRRLPWPAFAALLPAIVLLFTPASPEVELPGMLLGGAGLGIDSVSRWWLAMSFVAWVAAATVLYTGHGHDLGNSRRTTWFLLCLSGQSGALLAADIVSFFAFSSLMGYAFYGLLVDGGEAAAKRAGRVFLVLLVIADIVLFEALLIAASAMKNLGYTNIAVGIESSLSAGSYLALAVVGFVLKAGFWPVHVWLPPAYGSARPVAVLLLWVVPVATGLLGIVRWVPLGDMSEPVLGAVLQGLGAGALLYVVLFGLRQAQPSRRIAYAIVMATGAIAVILGTGLADPLFWEQYGRLLPLVVAAVGWALTAVTIGAVWMRQRQAPAAEGEELPWYERWQQAVVRRGGQVGHETLPGVCAPWLVRWRNLRSSRGWQRILDAAEHGLWRWTSAMVLFLLLAMLITLIHIGLQNGRAPWP